MFGTDINPTLVGWCEKNLPFGSFSTNHLSPPLAFPADSMGLIYAYSVFTHLPHDAQVAWRDDFARMLRPGGYLWLTVLNGDAENRAKFTVEETTQYDSGELVIRFGAAAGANQCTAFPPDAYLRTLFSESTGWRLVERETTGPRWASRVQDALLIQRV